MLGAFLLEKRKINRKGVRVGLIQLKGVADCLSLSGRVMFFCDGGYCLYPALSIRLTSKYLSISPFLSTRVEGVGASGN